MKKLLSLFILVTLCAVNSVSVSAGFYNAATEYDFLGSKVINNCVFFARYKQPALPFGLTSYASKKNICNSNEAIVGEVAVMPSTNAPSYGHVAYVEAVNGDNITILEGGVGSGHINRRTGTKASLNIYGFYNPGGLSNPNNGGGSASGVNVSEGIYSISPKNASGMCLDISGGSADSEANIQIWKSNGTTAQKFKITKSGSSYVITALCSNKALDVANGSSTAGSNVWQYTPNGTAAQKWSFVDAGSGYYYIKSDLGTYLDVYNAGKTDGTNVQAWSFNGSDAQKWKLSSAGTSGGNTRIGVIHGTDGTLVINSRPAKGNQIGLIPEGASCTVYPDRTSGNWYWVEYNGVSGYSYKAYIALQ